ncbi:MAG: DUF5060 domain-containing protein [Candidatus Brocadiia bacterium]
MNARLRIPLALVLAAAPLLAGSLEQRGTQWAPFLEWSLENPTCEGNPYDLAATATFVHEPSGERRTTGLFYAGGHTWKFRFTATRPGKWTFFTASGDPELADQRGVAVIEPNPGAPGFVTSFGSRWGRTGTDRAVVPQLVMYASPDRFYRKPEKIDADIQTFLVEHGFNGFHTYVCCRWFDIHEMRSDRIPSDDPDPDPRTFEALELLITKTHASGGVVHIWAWGDEARRWTPARWGKNGKADKRLQRYIAARLGPLPGWTMGYGFDNFEWVTEADLREWHRHMHRHLGWPHLLGARAHKNKLTQIYEGLDYAAYEQHRPDYATYRKTIEARPGKPSFSEDRFRIRQNGHAYKDYTEEMTRRGLWHSTLAGGVANIWGRLDGQSSHLGSKPYAHPEWIKTWSVFFRHRFLRDMVRDNALTDGVCLRRPTRAHYVFYKEDADGVRFDLSGAAGPQPAVAVDARKAYKEIDLGTLQPEAHAWKAPRVSDWAIAVGRFAP